MGPGTGLALVDARGYAMEFIRTLGLTLGIWHVRKPTELGSVPRGTLVMLAVYSGDELDRGYGLYQSAPTLVLGFGTGPREGSRALQLGAVGYVHDQETPNDLRDGIGQSFMRADRRWSRR